MNKKKLKTKYTKIGGVVERFQTLETLPENYITSFNSINPSLQKTVPNVFFNTCFDKNHLKTVIAWFLEHYGEKLTIDLVETLKQVGFHQATRAGVSLGVDDLQIPPQKVSLLSQATVKMTDVGHALEAGNLTSVEKSQRLIDTWNQTSETLRQTAVQNFRKTNPVNPVYMMAFSGARGNISQVRQLVAMRGLMADPQGAILEFPIQSNFREGLTVTEYLISCYGARKGLVDTALRTATSGYLTRRLVDAVQHVVIHVTNCHTKKGILIKDKNVEQRLIGRTLLEDVDIDSKTIIKKDTLISPRLAKQIAAKNRKIRVRSPLTCETEKSVCQLCYGLDLAQGKLVSLGEAVGIIAAQSIGEPGTQLTMRTFHTGGVGVFSEQAMKPFTAPFSGQIYFVGSLPGLFVRTPQGKIVYLLKQKSTDPEKTLLKLTSTDQTQKINAYSIKNGDVPPGSLLWVKQGELVKTGQLLLQASRLQTSKQEMPESSHPVRSPLSGEVFFQFIKIRVIEEQKNLTLKTKKKKQKNRITTQNTQKEISPTFPTLLELGNFWVFSSFIHKQAEICKSFLVEGDLISPETPTQQYNLQIPAKGQLKLVNSSLSFVQPSLELLFSKIYYSGGVYFFLTKQKQQTHHVFTYTTSSFWSSLTWYPFLQNLEFQSNCKQVPPLKGYFVNLPQKAIALKYKELPEKSTLKPETSERLTSSFLVSPHQVFYLKTFSDFSKNWGFVNKLKTLPFSVFLIAVREKTLSKKGFFQIKKNRKVFWSLKNTFRPVFQLNSLLPKCSGKSSLLARNKKTTLLSVSSKKVGDIQYSDKTTRSIFISKSLITVKEKIVPNVNTNLIHKKQVWFYIPETRLSKLINSQLTQVVLEPGKVFENIAFQSSFVSLNLLSRQHVFIVDSNKQTQQYSFFYSGKELLSQKKPFSQKATQFVWLLPKNSLLFGQISSSQFCFYKKEKFIPDQKRKLPKRSQKQTSVFQKTAVLKTKLEDFHQLSFQVKRKYRFLHLLVFQKNEHQFLPETNVFYQNWILEKNHPVSTFITSPLFTKQIPTIFSKDQREKVRFGSFRTPASSGWYSITNFLKINFRFQTPKTFRKIEKFQNNIFLTRKEKYPQNAGFGKRTKIFDKTSFPKSFLPGLTLLFYRRIILENGNTFCFQTFQDGWVLPDFPITQGFFKAKKLGEFRRTQLKQQEHYLSVLRPQDMVTLSLPNIELEFHSKTSLYQKIGARVRWGQELTPGFAVCVSGQIIKITLKTITLRKGIPFLASIRGLLHITQNDLVQKNDLLITLRSRRLQTEDIVQGIPKIEQLFEARETQGGEILKNNMHMLLSKFFSLARQVKPVPEAVELTLTYIQKFLVENILQAYSNQGVQIAEKHVEVVVRQMTARVRITNGGESGLLPGELVQLRLIEKMNRGLSSQGLQQASYEPIILGITKSVLQSESFLLAASFQQVSKVLVRSALAKKTDFLQGLHENILVGQIIPAGTGIMHFEHSPLNNRGSLREDYSDLFQSDTSLGSMISQSFQENSLQNILPEDS